MNLSAPLFLKEQTFTQEERQAQATAEAITMRAEQLLASKKKLTLDALVPKGVVIGSKAETSLKKFAAILQNQPTGRSRDLIERTLARMGAKLTNILLNHPSTSISKDLRIFEALFYLNRK